MSIEVTKVLSERKYSAGYVVRKELWSHDGEDQTEITAAYNPSGDYIGNSKWAYRLCNTRGIKPEKRSADSNVCSIGFCEYEKKWYGWSHRAIFGFGIGSSIKQGDCAYRPAGKGEWTADTLADAKLMACDFAEGVS